MGECTLPRTFTYRAWPYSVHCPFSLKKVVTDNPQVPSKDISMQDFSGSLGDFFLSFTHLMLFLTWKRGHGEGQLRSQKLKAITRGLREIESAKSN